MDKRKHEHIDPKDEIPVTQELEEGYEYGVPKETEEALEKEDRADA
jgi:hypothetical protein